MPQLPGHAQAVHSDQDRGFGTSVPPFDRVEHALKVGDIQCLTRIIDHHHLRIGGQSQRQRQAAACRRIELIRLGLGMFAQIEVTQAVRRGLFGVCAGIARAQLVHKIFPHTAVGVELALSDRGPATQHPETIMHRAALLLGKLPQRLFTHLDLTTVRRDLTQQVQG